MRKKTLTYSLLVSALAGWAGVVCADLQQGGGYTITRQVSEAGGGSSLQGGDGYTVGLTVGEPAAGYLVSTGDTVHVSGYYAGWVGNGLSFQMLASHVPASGPMSNDIQVGVPLDARIEIDLADQASAFTVSSGISVTILQDHLGTPQSTAAPFQIAYDPSGTTIYLSPQGNWLGNTIYDVQVSTGLRSLDGVPLQNPTEIRFLTVLDPAQSNMVLQPVDAGVRNAAPSFQTSAAASGPIMVQIAPNTFSNYSMVLVNSNALANPTRVNPQIIQDANRKAAAGGGTYQVPVAIQEVNAYGLSGQLMNALSEPAQISLPYQGSQLVSGMPAPVRSDTLSLWVLDETHHLWVKMPDSSVNTSGNRVNASVSQFAVFALMGQASGDAESVFVYPTPWRPHGPHAGPGPGQTGTEEGGITFANLPSECTIRIYTVSGKLVRTLQHSDTAGPTAQQTWDGFTTHGEHAASGVYLWRVESSADSKNGKLMLIR